MHVCEATYIYLHSFTHTNANVCVYNNVLYSVSHYTVQTYITIHHTTILHLYIYANRQASDRRAAGGAGHTRRGRDQGGGFRCVLGHLYMRVNIYTQRHVYACILCVYDVYTLDCIMQHTDTYIYYNTILTLHCIYAIHYTIYCIQVSLGQSTLRTL